MSAGWPVSDLNPSSCQSDGGSTGGFPDTAEVNYPPLGSAQNEELAKSLNQALDKWCQFLALLPRPFGVLIYRSG